MFIIIKGLSVKTVFTKLVLQGSPLICMNHNFGTALHIVII